MQDNTAALKERQQEYLARRRQHKRRQQLHQAVLHKDEHLSVEELLNAFDSKEVKTEWAYTFFWDRFKTILPTLLDRNSSQLTVSGSFDFYKTCGLGSGGDSITIGTAPEQNTVRIVAELPGSEGMKKYDYFFQRRDEIESAMKIPVQWYQDRQAKLSEITITCNELDFNTRTGVEHAAKCAASTFLRLHKAISCLWKDKWSQPT